MPGNQLMKPEHRVMLAASLFALVAALVFLLVWQWPKVMSLFRMDSADDAMNRELTEEEKMQILNELQLSNQNASEVTQTEQQAALESVSKSSASDENRPSEQEKINILNSLNAN
jgi:hypothetical protein